MLDYRVRYVLCLAGVLGASLVVAENRAAEVSAETSASALTGFVGGSFTSDRVSSDSAGRMSIQANSDSSQVSLSTGRTRSGHSVDSRVFSTWKIEAAAPLNKNNDKSDLATLDSLVNAATIGFQFSSTVLPETGAALSIDSAKYDEICTYVNEKYRLSDDYDAKNPKLDTCVDLGEIYKYAPENYDEWEAVFWNRDTLAHMYGISGKVGYESFDYLDAGSLADKSDEEYPWSAGVFWSVLPLKLNTLFSLSYDYQEGYKDQKAKTACPNADAESPGFIECKTGAHGKPLDDDRSIVAIEARRQFVGKGVSLKVSHDFKEDVTGVDLPVYLWKNKKGGLGGGVRFGWRDDTEDLTIGVFINAKGFSVF